MVSRNRNYILRNQILRKKNDRKEEDAKAYLIAGIDEDHSRTISYRTSLPTEDWMNNATLILKRTIVRPEGEQSLKDTIVITPQNIAASSGANSSFRYSYTRGRSSFCCQ